MNKIKVTLENGTEFYGDSFEHSDYLLLRDIFNDWLDINQKLKSLGGRNLNVPDVFSEGLFCYFFNAIRTNGTGYSYDCIALDTKKGIQVKSSSISEDLTSFGPTSTWDEIYFVDFAPNGVIDGNVYFYKIDFDFSNLVLNKSKGETFRDQQLQGRRPRFSIKKELILGHNLSPILTINLNDN